MSFSFIKKQEGGTGPAWGVVPMGGGGDGERVWEDEYNANTVYTCM
jgi:hypothetical protein